MYHRVLIQVSLGYPPIKGRLHTRYSPVRRSSASIATPATPRLACVKPAASVHPEPGSNSSLFIFFTIYNIQLLCFFQISNISMNFEIFSRSIYFLLDCVQSKFFILVFLLCKGKYFYFNFAKFFFNLFFRFESGCKDKQFYFYFANVFKENLFLLSSESGCKGKSFYLYFANLFFK